LTRTYNNYDPSWVLAFYTPHNSLLGLALFAGLVGIVGIWGVVPVAAYLAARGYKSSTDPIQRTAAMAAVGMMVAYSVHCYGDIGFQSFPCGLILGVALATAGKVAAWNARPAVTKQKEVRAPAAAPPVAQIAFPAQPTAVAANMHVRPALRRSLPVGAHGTAAQPGHGPKQRVQP
jgi:hypothetical protein